MTANGLVDFLFSFRGRVRRRDLWLFFLALAVIYGGLFWQFGHWHAWRQGGLGMGDWRRDYWHDGAMGMPHFYGYGFSFISHNPLVGLFSLAAIWMKLAVLVKRWHDRDKSGWWILIIIIPVIGWLWQLIECGFLDGSPGDNRFGPSPKGA